MESTPATNKHLATYLNDHLAGSTAGLEMLKHISTVYADSDVGPLASQLHSDVSADQQELERIMSELNIAQSGTRKLAGWIGEKFAQLKIRIDDPGNSGLHLLETLEAMSLGIEGKRLLWIALESAAEAMPQLRLADYVELRRRAEEQRGRVDERRRAVAQTAFSA